MTASNNATAEVGRPEGPLTELGPVVKEAIAFAEAVPQVYRSRVFELAYERLAGSTPAVPTPVSRAEALVPVTPIMTGGLSVLARELEVDPRALARVVAIGDDNALSIIGRIESRRNAEMQVDYSIMYMYSKERVFNQLDVPSEELREVCRLKSCYNKDHYADYFAKSDLVSPVGEGKSRAYRLTKKGVEAAKELLKTMVEG